MSHGLCCTVFKFINFYFIFFFTILPFKAKQMIVFLQKQKRKKRAGKICSIITFPAVSCRIYIAFSIQLIFGWWSRNSKIFTKNSWSITYIGYCTVLCVACGSYFHTIFLLRGLRCFSGCKLHVSLSPHVITALVFDFSGKKKKDSFKNV